MREWTAKELKPYAILLGRFDTLEFAGAASENAWRELATVLAEESPATTHARRVIDSFLRTPRFDEKGFQRNNIPSAPELRVFARSVPAVEPPSGDQPAPCPKCEPNDGLWQIVERGGVEAPVYCDCPLGEYLALKRASARSAA